MFLCTYGKEIRERIIVHADTFTDSAIEVYTDKKQSRLFQSEKYKNDNVIRCGDAFLCKGLQEIRFRWT